jgi:HEAT repeat protein
MSNDIYKMLRSQDMREFQNAVDALRGFSSDEATQMLIELCTDGNPEYRCREIDALAKIAPDRAESVGLQMLSDVEPAGSRKRDISDSLSKMSLLWLPFMASR